MARDHSLHRSPWSGRRASGQGTWLELVERHGQVIAGQLDHVRDLLLTAIRACSGQGAWVTVQRPNDPWGSSAIKYIRVLRLISVDFSSDGSEFVLIFVSDRSRGMTGADRHR